MNVARNYAKEQFRKREKFSFPFRATDQWYVSLGEGVSKTLKKKETINPKGKPNSIRSSENG